MKSSIVFGLALVAVLASCGKSDKLSSDNLKGSEWNVACQENTIVGDKVSEPAIRSSRTAVSFTETDMTVKTTAFARSRCNMPAGEVAWTYSYDLKEKVSDEFEFGRKEQSETLFPVKKIELTLKALTLSFTKDGEAYVNHAVKNRVIPRPQIACKDIPLTFKAPIDVLKLTAIRNHPEDYTKGCEFAFNDGVKLAMSNDILGLLYPAGHEAKLTHRPFYGYDQHDTEKPVKAAVGAKSVSTIQLADREAKLGSLYLMPPVAFDEELPPFAGAVGVPGAQGRPFVFSKAK